MAGANIGDLEIQYVTDALKNGWYKNKYYYVEKLESEFASYHNRKYGLMTPNCTSAIHLLLAALDIGKGDEVIIPECTWIASAVGAYHLGAKIIFCDIENDSWCLDPQSVKENITPQTKAIISVDLFGNMANWSELNKISKEYNIPLIEDAAEALGSTLNGKKAGSFGIGSVFSFHNTKTMTTGEGGMLLIDDDSLYENCIKLRDLGRGTNTKPYFNELVGYKFMPFNMQAALGLAQFERLDELISLQRYHFDFYKNELSILYLKFNYEHKCLYNSYWIKSMVIRENYNINKHDLIKELEKKGIPSRPFFYPLTTLPAFRKESSVVWNGLKTNNPVSVSISNRGINLPGAPNLTNKDLKIIVNGIKKVLNK